VVWEDLSGVGISVVDDGVSLAAAALLFSSTIHLLFVKSSFTTFYGLQSCFPRSHHQKSESL
jgi:hypothetical protein